MVDGIASTARVTLHQALHGYAEGHGQLATSVNLKPRDNKTLLILSDISGPGAPLDDAGYLTGYPLPDSGFYAFARTWPAPEMSRPGCVWTHTLLIDFADVPAVNSMTELVSAFRRPNGSAYDGFGKPIVLHLPAIQARIKESDAPAARKIVSALYAKPDAKVIAGRAATSDVDRLVTVLWSQQWPRLRRAFRFCTSAATDRSLSDTSFDLQFLPGNGQALRTRFPNVVDAEDAVEVGGWLDEAVADLVRPEPDGLREFLRRIGLDIPGGRNVFRNLCQLFILTRKFPSEADALEQAVQLLDIEFGDAPARAARATVAAAALPRAELLSDAGFEYLLNHLNVVEPSTFAASANVLGRAILHRSPAALGPMLKADDGMLRNFAEDTLRDASAPDLATAIKAAPAIALPILTRRAELAALPSLWSRDLRVENSAFEALRVRGLPSSVVIAMIKAGRTDLARQATKEAGALEVLQALSSVMWSEPFVRGECETWLREAAQPREVAQLLTGPQGQPRALLALIAHVTRPDDVPNDSGEDPWLSALYRAHGTAPDADETHLRAFLLARSLGRKSRSQAELAQAAFEYVHAAAAANRLPDESWRLLDPLLPWTVLWFDWDRCQRLRAGVVDLFVDSRLDAGLFGQLVQSRTLFELLTSQAERTSAGRRYLKAVHHALEDATAESYVDRRRYIEKLLK